MIGACLAISCAAAKEPISIKCTDRSGCAVVDETGKHLLDGLPAMATVQPLGDQWLEIKASCGSPCSASAYYDKRTRRISELFPDVFAVGLELGRVAFAKDRKLYHASIFPGASSQRPVLLKTKKPLAEAAAIVSVVVTAEFVKPASLELSYLSGADFQEVTETIPLRAAKP